MLVLPVDAELSTPAVYREADRLGAHAQPRRAGQLDALVRVGTWAPENDLQDAARSLCPLIDTALAAARDAGADHVLVSGSGPTVVGLFGGADGPARAAAAASAVRLAARRRGRAGRRGVGGRARLMHPFPLAGAIGLAIFLAVRFRKLGRTTLVLGVVVVVGARARGASGSSSRRTSRTLIEDVGTRLGKWTYLLVGALAFLETGRVHRADRAGGDRGAHRRRRRRAGRDLDRDADRRSCGSARSPAT